MEGHLPSLPPSLSPSLSLPLFPLIGGFVGDGSRRSRRGGDVRVDGVLRGLLADHRLLPHPLLHEATPPLRHFTASSSRSLTHTLSLSLFISFSTSLKGDRQNKMESFYDYWGVLNHKDSIIGEESFSSVFVVERWRNVKRRWSCWVLVSWYHLSF
jgi:hypothetical protein